VNGWENSDRKFRVDGIRRCLQTGKDVLGFDVFCKGISMWHCCGRCFNLIVGQNWVRCAVPQLEQSKSGVQSVLLLQNNEESVNWQF
jgi:hypothetical protein